MSDYSEKVVQHFQNPQNAGILEKPDGEATVSNPICGDTMHITLRIENLKIIEMRWQTRGCPAAIATSSYTSEIVRNMPIDEARTITRESILHGIGGLPRDKYHCSVLAADALNKAIVHFEQFKKTS
tara:strand:- start:1324 stop:1704 length:381 start_codon:yes stop_codon:yes gene_type:complete